MENVYLRNRLVSGFSLGLAEPPMNLVVCDDGHVRPAGTCPMNTGAEIAIGSGLVAAGLVLWAVFHRKK